MHPRYISGSAWKSCSASSEILGGPGLQPHPTVTPSVSSKCMLQALVGPFRAVVAITVSGPRGGGTSSAATLVMAGLSVGITSQLACEGGVSGTSLNKAFGEAGHSTLSAQSSCPRSTRTALPASSCMDGSFWRTWSQMEHTTCRFSRV